MIKQTKTMPSLTAKQANAMLIMLEAEIEQEQDFNPLTDYEFTDLHVSKLEAYGIIRQWYEANIKKGTE